MNDKLIQTFLELVTIPSPSRNERDIANYIMKKLAKYPLSIEEDHTGETIGGSCGNIIVRIPGKGIPILFDAHMDTVSPCESIHPQIKEGIIYSDRSSILGADDKVGIAVMLCAIEQIMQENIAHPPLTFIFSVCEEEGLQGAKHLDVSSFQDIRYAYILDGEGAIGSITNKTPFGAKGCLSFTGKEAHAGVCPEKGINALVVASEAITKLTIGRIDENTTCNIGKIEGGTATNVVMGKVEMSFEARSYDRAQLVELIAHVLGVCEEVCTKHHATFENSIAYGTPGYAIEDNDAIATSFQEVCEQTGFVYHATPCGGGSNANIYRMKGIPSLCVGTNMKDVHSVEESIAIKDIEDLYTLVFGIISYMADKKTV